MHCIGARASTPCPPREARQRASFGSSKGSAETTCRSI
jgi:hypothetical protein